MADSPRLEELRRRVQADPASIAFAALAEEYRRAGKFREAVEASRAGLRYHPTYVSARVTLGRSLVELQEVEQAERELVFVLKSAPDNLAARRALGELCWQQLRFGDALTHFRAAHALAPGDTELPQILQSLERELAADHNGSSEPTGSSERAAEQAADQAAEHAAAQAAESKPEAQAPAATQSPAKDETQAVVERRAEVHAVVEPRLPVEAEAPAEPVVATSGCGSEVATFVEEQAEAQFEEAEGVSFVENETTSFVEDEAAASANHADAPDHGDAPDHADAPDDAGVLDNAEVLHHTDAADHADTEGDVDFAGHADTAGHADFAGYGDFADFGDFEGHADVAGRADVADHVDVATVNGRPHTSSQALALARLERFYRAILTARARRQAMAHDGAPAASGTRTPEL